MDLQYFIFPSVILTILICWLSVGNKINKRNSTKGFLFLSLYALLATHGCLAVSEERWSIASENERNIVSFLETNGVDDYQFFLVKLKEKQFIRVRPWSENIIEWFLYNIYRNVLLNSWIPEYIYNINGQLVDWTTDNHDDPEYQNKWDYLEELKELKGSEILKVVNKE